MDRLRAAQCDHEAAARQESYESLDSVAVEALSLARRQHCFRIQPNAATGEANAKRLVVYPRRSPGRTFNAPPDTTPSELHQGLDWPRFDGTFGNERALANSLRLHLTTDPLLVCNGRATIQEGTCRN